VPELIQSILAFAGITVEAIDSYLFHQSNRFIMKHIAKKCGLPEHKVPLCLENFGNSGGPSVAVALTQAFANGDGGGKQVMLLGYGVGLSWAAAIVRLPPDLALLHNLYDGTLVRQ
jgi:3-oxoacyl-[acyl-carrier-protein] synthase III